MRSSISVDRDLKPLDTQYTRAPATCVMPILGVGEEIGRRSIRQHRSGRPLGTATLSRGCMFDSPTVMSGAASPEPIDPGQDFGELNSRDLDVGKL